MKLNEYEHAISQPSLIWNPNKGKPQMGGSCSAKWGPYGSKSGSTTDPFLLLFVVLNRPGRVHNFCPAHISLSVHTYYIYSIYICIVIVWWWSSENSNLRLFALILLSSLSQKGGLPGNYLTFLAPVSPVRRCGFLAVATWQTWASRGVKLSNKNGLMLWYICVVQLYTSIAPNIPQLT
jgi:hypothetical protein